MRLNLNLDCDRLHIEANNHRKLRQNLGYRDLYDEHYYKIQTLKDNVSLLTVDSRIVIPIGLGGSLFIFYN